MHPADYMQINNTEDESQQTSLSDDTATLLENFAELYGVDEAKETVGSKYASTPTSLPAE